MAKRKQLGFKFEVGEVVGHRHHIATPLLIIEREFREWDSGSLRQYYCRTVNNPGQPKLWFIESELVRLAKPRFSKTGKTSNANVGPVVVKWNLSTRKLRRKKSPPAARRKTGSRSATR